MWENLDFKIQAYLQWTCLVVPYLYSYATVGKNLEEFGRIGTSKCSCHTLKSLLYILIHYEITVKNEIPVLLYSLALHRSVICLTDI